MRSSSFTMPAQAKQSRKYGTKTAGNSVFRSLLKRSQDPGDKNMHLIIIALSLLFDSALTCLIIAKVPCASFVA